MQCLRIKELISLRHVTTIYFTVISVLNPSGGLFFRVCYLSRHFFLMVTPFMQGIQEIVLSLNLSNAKPLSSAIYANFRFLSTQFTWTKATVFKNSRIITLRHATIYFRVISVFNPSGGLFSSHILIFEGV